MRRTVKAFDVIKDLYKDDEDFAEPWRQCSENHPPVGFKIQEGFLFRENRLCIPKTSQRLQLILETHAGGLAGHFGRDKTVAQLEAKFLWPGLKKETGKVVQGCQEAKGTKQNTGLYTSLPTPTEP